MLCRFLANKSVSTDYFRILNPKRGFQLDHIFGLVSADFSAAVQAGGSSVQKRTAPFRQHIFLCLGCANVHLRSAGDEFP